MGACLHAGTTGSSPVSWAINVARGHGEVSAEDRRAVALNDALPSRPGEFMVPMRVCPHRAGGPGRSVRPRRVGRRGGKPGRDGGGLAAPGRHHGHNNADAYRNADALDPLRDRNDVRLLMMALAFPTEPFAKDTDADR
jgi:hypothetical protein